MISFVIPTLNEESVLEKTLQNLLLLQGFVDFEIIVSDGKSTDKTVEIARKYGCQIVVHAKTTRQTIGEARNLGAAEAKGEYLVFLDADVRMENPVLFFQKAFQIFESKKNLVGLTVVLKVFPEMETFADKIIFGVVNTIFYFCNNMVHRGMASGEFQMVRASAFRDVGGYNETLIVTEDNEFFLRLSKIGETYFERSLQILHTGRRAHRVGWPRLLWQWISNAVSVFILKKSVSREWKPIR